MTSAPLPPTTLEFQIAVAPYPNARLEYAARSSARRIRLR
jgi:hypothetical protein